MSIPASKYKDISFYSRFKYMRLTQSGSVTVAAPTTVTIPITDDGVGTPFVFAFWQNSSGHYQNLTGRYMTGGTAKLDATGDNLLLVMGPGASGDIYYYIYRTNT